MLTVELVLQPPAVGQLCPDNLSPREDPVQHGAEEVVCQSPPRRLPAGEPPDSILRPANLLLQDFEIERLRAKERGRGAARDVVAGEGEDVDEDRESEADGGGARTGGCQLP